MFNRVEAKLLAKQQIQGNILTLFIIWLIATAITGACAGIPVFGWVAYFVITPSIELGVILIYLNMAKGNQPDIGRMFDGFQNVGPCVILFLLTWAYTILWSMLFVIPGIIKSLSYSMGMYILAEHPEMTATEALNESKRIMVGHKGELFVLYLSFIGWALLSVPTFGLIYIWLLPYMKMTTANFYNSIKQPILNRNHSAGYNEYNGY